MSRAKKKNSRKPKGYEAECKRMHLDTEEKADAILAVAVRQHPGSRPMKQYDSKCKAWHVGLVK